jgi:hypothetical protein
MGGVLAFIQLMEQFPNLWVAKLLVGTNGTMAGHHDPTLIQGIFQTR